jgi:intein/homing endonuclease
MKPYCVLPSECCAFILNGKKIYASLEQIYEMLEEKEIWDYNQDVFLKLPNNLMVLDYDPKTQKSRYTKVTCISNKETEKDFYFTKATNGMSLITTEDHSFISDEKEIEAKSLQRKDIIYTTFDKDLFTYCLNTYNGLELTEDLGWLIGIYLAEGYNQKGQLSICQSKEKSPYEWNKIIRILENIGIPFTTYEDRNIIRLKNGDNNWERKILTIAQGKYCDEKKLCPDFIHFNKDFLRGFISGIIDGDGTIADNRTCMIRLTSRTLINQIRLIGLSFGIYFYLVFLIMLLVKSLFHDDSRECLFACLHFLDVCLLP